MSRLHFIYAGFPDDGRIQSPYCITRHLYHYLKERVDVVYHEWSASYDMEIGPDDVLIGHPHYDVNTMVQRFFRSGKPCRAKCLIHPLHTRRVEDNMPFDSLSRQADRIFSICGPYWYDTIDSTPFAHWKEKIVRLDMAVDASLWPFRKSSFNGSGNRGVVYVGSGMPQKNVPMLTEIARRMKDVRFDWYGGSGDAGFARLPNTHVEGWCQFTPEKVAQICYRNDLFVNCSVSDANPTTLLEFGLASGIIPICTETSGYWRDECFTNIPMDVDRAVAIIRDWLAKPSEELLARAVANRKICEEKYTWQRFCETVWEGLKPYFNPI
jgi:glycosyltransferase involved in cell wall biosynthesis